MCGEPCADDLNGSIYTGEEAGQVTFRRWRTPDDDLAHLFLRMLEVVVIDGMLVIENGRGFAEGYAVLGFVARGFVFVPFELEGFLFFHKASIACVLSRSGTSGYRKFYLRSRLFTPIPKRELHGYLVRYNRIIQVGTQ